VRYYHDDQIESMKWEVHAARMTDMRDAYRMLVVITWRVQMTWKT